MVKQMIWASLAILITWLILDQLLHRWLLRPAYDASASLWRPTDKLNIPLIYFVMLVLIGTFVLIYSFLIEQKSLISGIKFGVLFGLALSISSGFGTYIHMPIPLQLAWGWFLGGLMKAVAAGAIVGLLIKRNP
jgi:hypothetical protein